MLQNVQKRDSIDQSRDASPLKKAPDALLLDNSSMTREEQLAWVLDRANSIMKQK
ncbi:MAG TPA: (d)CMP kinase [Prolixibacteraceae bacterium]|nr:(d)CMP kinase [Prolixibacteraceae bacterium]